MIIGAVADGAGCAKYADIGAKLAVERVLEYLAGVEQWLQKHKKIGGINPQPLPELEARRLFTQTVNEVVAAMDAQALSKSYSIDDLACTLLVVIATPTWVAAMQIGDGFIDGLERVAIRMSDSTPFTPFFQPLEEYLQETSHPEQSDEYLMSFLDSDRLNARTDDDKTLLLCLYDSPHSR